jgi:hypothetical protein
LLTHLALVRTLLSSPNNTLPQATSCAALRRRVHRTRPTGRCVLFRLLFAAWASLAFVRGLCGFICLLPPVLQGGRLPSPSRRLHVAVLQGQTPPPCRCAAGSNTSTMSLCCRVKHLHHVAVLQGQTPPPCRCAAGSNTSAMSLCCMVKHLHHVAVLQGQTPPPCRCAAGSNTSTMSLCCRVDDDCSPLLCCRVSEPFFPSYAPPVLQGGGQSLCCRVDDSLCCRVDPFLCLHLFPFCLLCCRVDDCRRLRVVSMSLCCRVDDACPLERNFLPVLQGRRFSVLQGRRFSVLQGQHTIICAAGSTHSCAAGSRGFRSML